jgi:hypothetical protein
MRTKSFFAMVLAAALVAAPASIRAAPDQTLSMALMSATVSDSGVLVAGSGVVSITGAYDIAFERDLEACTCTASFGSHNDISWLGENYISANCPFGAGNNVRVLMLSVSSDGGVPVNRPFQLIVFCPK